MLLPFMELAPPADFFAGGGVPAVVAGVVAGVVEESPPEQPARAIPIPISGISLMSLFTVCSLPRMACNPW